MKDDNAPTFSAVTPYLRYPDGDAAVAWLTSTFGFGPAQSARDDSGAWFEGSLKIGSAEVSISGGAAEASGGYLIVSVADVDSLYERVRAAGVDVDPPQDKPYGPRTMAVTDPWHTTWDFWQGEARIDGS